MFRQIADNWKQQERKSFCQSETFGLWRSRTNGWMRSDVPCGGLMQKIEGLICKEQPNPSLIRGVRQESGFIPGQAHRQWSDGPFSEGTADAKELTDLLSEWKDFHLYVQVFESQGTLLLLGHRQSLIFLQSWMTNFGRVIFQKKAEVQYDSVPLIHQSFVKLVLLVFFQDDIFLFRIFE